MSKKRSKSATGSAGMQRWEQALLSTSFVEEDKWTASIAFVVGNQLEDYTHIDVLAGAVAAGTRKLFNVITKDDLYAQVNELGNPKAKKAKEIPQNHEICEPCKDYLDSGEDIPVALLAKLLKFRLLDVKQKDLKRRENDKKAASEKDKPKKGADKKDRSKSPAKGGKGGKKTPEPPSAKAGSKLRKRGEEDSDSKYIDDEPDDGPNNYIYIVGFHEPHLVSQLSELGIHMDCIIKVTSEDYGRFERRPSPSDELDPPPEKDDKQLAADEEAKKLTDKKIKDIKKFWQDVPLVLQMAVPGSRLHDVAILNYTVQESAIPETLEDNEMKTQFGVDLYENTACKLYDLVDSKRQWKNFLANVKLTHIPDYCSQAAVVQDSQSVPSITPAPTTTKTVDKATEATTQGETDIKPPTEVDMRYYTELMNVVPQESVSVPLVMHCMLEQVVATDEDKEPPSETPRPPRSDGLEDSLANHINTVAFKLALSEEEQQALAGDFEPPKKPEPIKKQPLLIHYNDDMSRRLSHLKPTEGFNPMEAELEMMGYFPVSGLQDFPCTTPRESMDRAARLQELLHFCATGGVTTAEVDHAFKQFVLECMDLTQTDHEGNVQPPSNQMQVDIPWDDPYPYFKGMIPEVINDDDSLKESALLIDPRSGAKSPLPDEDVSCIPSEAALSQDGAENIDSRPGSGSILRREGSAGSRKSTSAHSVHFERDDEGNLVLQPGDDGDVFDDCVQQVTPSVDVPVEDPMTSVNDVQKRNMDQWGFAEHMDPQVFLQALRNSQHSHPYIDTYYHKRDNSLMVVLHNPYAENLQSKVDWHFEAHSDVGFRNYLEYISESISEWTRSEEAKYQATQLASEVEKIQKEADEASSRPSSAKDKKRDRSKSPKKSPSRSGKSPSRSSSTERPSSSNPYVRQGSLKAWKEEQDRVKAEEDEKEKQKQEKRARSAQKKASKGQLELEKKEKEKRPGSRSSSKSKMTKEEPAPPAEQQEEPKAEEPYHPFYGYDVGNNLLHARGTVSSLFPADGGQIRTEKYEFIHGTVGVKASVLKDGHTFMVHVLDPKGQEEEEEVITPSEPEAQDGQEKGEIEKSEKDEQNTARTDASSMGEAAPDGSTIQGAEEPSPKKPCVGRFGSFNAQMNDGMSLSLSVYGASGEPDNGKKYEPDAYVAPVRSQSPSGKDNASPSKGKKDKSKEKSAATPEPPAQDEEPKKEEVKVEVKIPKQSFQQLYVTCPDGLNVNYFLESEAGIAPDEPESRKLLVRQSYPYPTSGNQSCEAARKAAMDEVSRVVSGNGTVIKVLKDGTTQVMYGDGGVSQFCLSTPLVPASRNASPQRAGSAKSDRATPTKKKERHSRSARKKVEEAPVEEAVIEPGYWITTTSSGERICTAMDGTKVAVKDTLVCKATDPQTRQVMYTRDDHTVIVHHPDGTTVVEHADGTRIMTFISEIKMPSENTQSDETGECENVPMETKKVKLVQVECPGFATLRFDTETSECSTEFGTGTIINTFIDGSYDVYHNDGGYLRVETDGTTVYHARPNNDLEILDQKQVIQYVLRHFADVIVETVDNQGNIFNVTNHGESSVDMASGNEIIAEETGLDKDVMEGEGQLEGQEEGEYSRQTPQSDLVLKTKSVTHYKQHAPKFFLVHPDGSGTELLRYQDVSEYIANAEDDLSTAILMDPLIDHPGVLGITIMTPYTKNISEKWMKGYTQSSILPKGLNSRDLTTLPAKEVKKDGPAFGTNVGQGLAVGSLVRNPPQPPVIKCPSALEIRQLLQYKPVSEEMRDKLGSTLREYAEHVKAQQLDSECLQVHDPRSEDERILAADQQSEMIPEVIPESETNPLEGDVKVFYEKAIAPPIPSPPPTPQPKRTQADWERDARELAQEQADRQALREHDVPQYFDSQMGKAFLLTQAPDIDSLTKQLSEDPRRDETRAVRSGSNTPTSEPLSSSVLAADNGATHSSLSTTTPPVNQGNNLVTESPTLGPRPAGNTPSALRPGNPTPAHATGQGSPTNPRPLNPTPAHATKLVPDRPGAPTPAAPTQSDTPQSNGHPCITEQPLVEQSPTEGRYTGLSQSTHITVLGEPRLDPVRIPAYIRSGRPGASPNDKFGLVEDPVRRKPYTTSITGATPKGSQILARMRGFELLPDCVDFGVLREGHTYNFTVFLKNTGVDACRFKVVQPPPSTGMKVLFKPGPVAAGLRAEITLEIYAIAVGVQGGRGVGRICHDLKITTETDHLFLPITATVLTAYEYDNRDSESPKGAKAPGVHHISSKAPGGKDIIRARTWDKNGKEVGGVH